MNRFFILLMAGAFALVTGPAAAPWASELSADLPDSRTLKTQQKVERLFLQGEFDRAFFIYRNELAPIGDKYAQYMVGFMYETGSGTGKSRVAASAWYRLSAERDTPEFIAVRDKMMHSLDENETLRSDAQYLDLRRRYSDIVVVMASIKRNHNELEDMTGSRLRAGSGPSTIIDTRSGRIRSGSEYFTEVRDQMHERIRLLIQIGGFTEIDDVEHADLRQLERLVNERIEAGN